MVLCEVTNTLFWNLQLLFSQTFLKKPLKLLYCYDVPYQFNFRVIHVFMIAFSSLVSRQSIPLGFVKNNFSFTRNALKHINQTITAVSDKCNIQSYFHLFSNLSFIELR